MINQKLYTRAGVQEYANMGDLESERSQLVALLNSQLALIPSTLTAPMEQLSMSLGQLAKGETTSLASSNDSPKNWSVLWCGHNVTDIFFCWWNLKNLSESTLLLMKNQF
jgi:hypothetical protein